MFAHAEWPKAIYLAVLAFGGCCFVFFVVLFFVCLDQQLLDHRLFGLLSKLAEEGDGARDVILLHGLEQQGVLSVVVSLVIDQRLGELMHCRIASLADHLVGVDEFRSSCEYVVGRSLCLLRSRLCSLADLVLGVERLTLGLQVCHDDIDAEGIDHEGCTDLVSARALDDLDVCRHRVAKAGVQRISRDHLRSRL